jgi:hypothetical protein
MLALKLYGQQMLEGISDKHVDKKKVEQFTAKILNLYFIGNCPNMIQQNIYISN